MDSTPLMPSSSDEKDIRKKGSDAVSTRSISPVELLRETVHDVEVPNEDSTRQNDPSPPTATLQSSSWILYLALAYAALAVFTWVTQCVLTFHPIRTADYHSIDGMPPNSSYSSTLGEEIQSLHTRNQRWLQATRVVQSVVGVIAIPLTSAVCSKAAIVFTQRSSKREKLSLRKMVTLANHGWTDPEVYAKLLFGGFRRYASSLLLFAIFLNVLGGLIPPLQSYFVHTSTMKTPTSPSSIYGIADVRDFFGYDGNLDSSNRVSVLTRSAITSTFTTDPQSRLWSQGKSNCDASSGNEQVLSPPSCSEGTANLSNMSQLIDPFLAYLPSGFNTGLIRQFIPRMNSTITRQNVTDVEFPTGCESLPGAFYVNYAHPGVFNSTDYAGSWSIVVCMPTNQSTSPWQATRNRQDISEQLYLNISTNSYFSDGTPYTALLEVTLRSTLGYFEMPNYFNGQIPGPLLEKDPWGPDDQSSSPQIPPVPGSYRRSLYNSSVGMSNSSKILGNVPNKGPLLNIAMALFGESSFIATRWQHPEIYLMNETYASIDEAISQGINEDVFDPRCVDLEPLMGLLMGPSWQESSESRGLYPGCIENGNNQDDVLQRQIEQWMLSLANGFPSDVIANAFEAAAFLANEAWLIQSVTQPSLFVSYDLGADTETLVISKGGVILISLLWLVYLTAMLALAVYSARTPVWTSNLDAFAMMRIGAAISSDISLVYVQGSDKVEFLDERPGWIGDATGGHGAIGELGLGANTALTKKRKMRCYEE